MLNGVVVDHDEGTPQGGPLSPRLANVLLDEIDKILEARGHRFVRYADDCNIYVRSQRAGERVMATMHKELSSLRLRINEAKSAVDRPWNRKFLGFTFRRGRETRRRVSPRAIEKAKDRIRELTSRNRGASVRTVVKELTMYLWGWLQYFGICEVPTPRRDLDKWIPQPAAAPAGQAVETRHDGLPAACGHGRFRTGRDPYGAEPSAMVVRGALTGHPADDAAGLFRSARPSTTRNVKLSNRPVRTRMPGGVAGVWGSPIPYAVRIE